jgi:reductive dehalogenase
MGPDQLEGFLIPYPERTSSRRWKMVSVLVSIGILFLAIIAFFSLAFVVSSIWERERRAALIGGLISCVLLGLIAVLFVIRETGFFRTTIGLTVLLAGLIVMAGAFLLMSKRTAQNPRALEGTKGYVVGEVERFDERNQVFARNRSLPPDSEQYRAFYSEHPQWEAFDAERRKRGGPLGVPGIIDKPHEGPNVAALLSTFSVPPHLGRPDVVQPKAHPHFHGGKISLSPEEATARVKGFARHVGADLVGIAETNPLWVYARRGEIFYDNWEQWGEEIHVDHKYAVVFAVEMSWDMVRTAPHTPSVIETGLIYAKAAFIATLLGSFIANLGYSATANHLRRYDVLLVPMAVDAGLGEVGRLGYLMTREFGPRVRLGCVTTDLPLVPDRPVDIGVEGFCSICKKGALCCPSRSIPFDDLREVGGTLRWKLNAETCFEYWGKAGTDCNICMMVCPWSHRRTLPHRAITEMVSRSRIARSVFSPMDDAFYGRKPKPCSFVEWADYTQGKRRESNDGLK